MFRKKCGNTTVRINMSYRNLTRTIANIEAAGLTETVQRILDAAKNETKIPYEVTLEFTNPKQAKRCMMLIYEILYFHPAEKTRLSLSHDNNNIKVKFRNKLENRGRKGLKEAK